MYRLGFPGWKLAARMGIPLLIKLDVVHDREAAVFVATSRDLKGLVVEVPDSVSAEDFHKEIHDCVDMLMADLVKSGEKPKTVTAWPGEFQPA